ncbi:hypothetical protein CsSME_00002147 [Camellia sinensis var. sinensis]
MGNLHNHFLSRALFLAIMLPIVNLERVEHFVQAVGCHEDAIFRKRSQQKMILQMNLLT